MINYKIKKLISKIIILITFLILLPSFCYANTYSNNSISIEVSPEKRTYDYKEDVGIYIKIENKNRYAKLHYKINEVYTGGSFNALNLSDNYNEIEPLADTELTVKMHDNFINEKPEKAINTHITFNDGYTHKEPDGDAKSDIGHENSYRRKIHRFNIGQHSYEVTDEEYEELKKFRREKEPNERISNNESVGRLSTEKENFTRGANAVIIIIIIIILLCIILVIFIWYIVKAKRGGGSKYLSIVLVIGLIVLSMNNKIYAADTYQENVHYNKEINTRCTYWDLDCSFTVRVEYYFENTIAPITDLELDTDNDNLPDYLEVLYLTDLNNSDTDGDEIPDGDEVYFTYTDPNRKDTDNNGTLDSDEDYDKDGLSNKEEVNYGTRSDEIDTDYDSLSDYDEINGVKTKDGSRTYITDPTSEDTDEDGLKDDTELKLNLDPTNPNDADTRVTQTISDSILPKNLTIESATPISFSGNLVGDIDENVSAKITEDSYFDSLQYIIGKPIIITTKYANSDGLKITYDLTKYSTIKNRISLNRWEDGKLVEVLGYYLSGNSLISNCHSGIYVLVDSNAYMQDLNIFIN